MIRADRRPKQPTSLCHLSRVALPVSRVSVSRVIGPARTCSWSGYLLHTPPPPRVDCVTRSLKKDKSSVKRAHLWVAHLTTPGSAPCEFQDLSSLVLWQYGMVHRHNLF